MLLVSHNEPPKEGRTMFPHYDQMSALVGDRHRHYEAKARHRRFLRAARQSSEGAPTRVEPTTTPLDAIPTAARQVVSPGRTPGETHRAA